VLRRRLGVKLAYVRDTPNFDVTIPMTTECETAAGAVTTTTNYVLAFRGCPFSFANSDLSGDGVLGN